MGVPIAAALLLIGVIAAAGFTQALPAAFAPNAPAVARLVERRTAPIASVARAPTARGAQARAVRPSVALGQAYAGHLMRGMQLPSAGIGFVSWDDLLHRSPDRGWRRFATDRMIDFLEELGVEWKHAHPHAPRLLIGDLSRTHGGPFGSEYGGLGHGSHQNGLDADIYYPRRDGREIAVTRVSQIDHRLAQDLVNRIVRKGVQFAFVGPHTGLTGPKGVVIRLVDHDDHVHVRIWNR
jgi:murein endopeptidase